jgi:hypothetical protein
MRPDDRPEAAPPTLEPELIFEARAFSQEAGLEIERVLALLVRAAALQTKHGKQFHRVTFDLLRGAARESPPRQVLRVMEREDLGALVMRSGLPAYFASPDTPLYTLGASGPVEGACGIPV